MTKIAIYKIDTTASWRAIWPAVAAGW